MLRGYRRITEHSQRPIKPAQIGRMASFSGMSVRATDSQLERNTMYNRFFDEPLDGLRSAGQYRFFTSITRIAGRCPIARIDDRKDKEVVVWCSNDYLGMSSNPDVMNAMVSTVEKYGVGSGGSRNISGNCVLHQRLEDSIAEWHGKEAALTFPTGYGSIDATIQCLLRSPTC